MLSGAAAHCCYQGGGCGKFGFEVDYYKGRPRCRLYTYSKPIEIRGETEKQHARNINQVHYCYYYTKDYLIYVTVYVPTLDILTKTTRALCECRIDLLGRRLKNDPKEEKNLKF